jgi:hypothetical protein
MIQWYINETPVNRWKPLTASNPSDNIKIQAKVLRVDNSGLLLDIILSERVLYVLKNNDIIFPPMYNFIGHHWLAIITKIISNEIVSDSKKMVIDFGTSKCEAFERLNEYLKIQEGHTLEPAYDNKTKPPYTVEIINIDNRSFEYFEFCTCEDVEIFLDKNLKDNEIAEYTDENGTVKIYKKDKDNNLIEVSREVMEIKNDTSI